MCNQLKNFAECDKDTMDMVVDATTQLAEDVLDPLTMESDRNGCVWVDEVCEASRESELYCRRESHCGCTCHAWCGAKCGPYLQCISSPTPPTTCSPPHHPTKQNTIKTSKGTKEAYDVYKEAGWQGLSYPEEWGGQNLPMSMALLQAEMMAGANFTFTMFPGLSKGAINTILMHGSDELKENYLPQMVSGEFTGTMCLTEPGCGSDLGQVITKAEREADGSYKISGVFSQMLLKRCCSGERADRGARMASGVTILMFSYLRVVPGTKIFISCGDHDLADNVIHCVLARLTDAPPAAASPAGTRGISLFLVPKFLPDGSRNGVTVSRIEDKMGCHGYAAAALIHPLCLPA